MVWCLRRLLVAAAALMLASGALAKQQAAAPPKSGVSGASAVNAIADAAYLACRMFLRGIIRVWEPGSAASVPNTPCPASGEQAWLEKARMHTHASTHNRSSTRSRSSTCTRAPTRAAVPIVQTISDAGNEWLFQRVKGEQAWRRGSHCDTGGSLWRLGLPPAAKTQPDAPSPAKPHMAPERGQRPTQPPQ
jgi:hypothetical protein